MRRSLFAAVAILCACGTTEPRGETAAHIIVRWDATQQAMSSRLREIEEASGVRMEHVREISGGAHVLRVLDSVDEDAVDAALRRLNTLPQVRYAVRDGRRTAQ